MTEEMFIMMIFIFVSGSEMMVKILNKNTS